MDKNNKDFGKLVDIFYSRLVMEHTLMREALEFTVNFIKFKTMNIDNQCILLDTLEQTLQQLGGGDDN